MLLISAATVSAAAPADELPLVDSGSSPAAYRWLDVADQSYSPAFQAGNTYGDAVALVSFVAVGPTLSGSLSAAGLKPNFTYQLKLDGDSGTPANERIGLAGRWWQEEWNGSAWTNGQNLNNKGDGSFPNPNDLLYFERRYVEDSSSPTGLHYRYTGYLVFDYVVTDSEGSVLHGFVVDSCYHVLWKTTQRVRTTDDGPISTAVFDADDSAAYEDTGGDDYPGQSVSVFGEWERLPVGGVFLQPGTYSCRFTLTEESFHGSGGPQAGAWAAAMEGQVVFAIAPETMNISLSCLPAGGTVPFSSLFTVTLANTTSFVRVAAARINVVLADGQYYSNWRAGHTNVAAGSIHQTSWITVIPALGSLIGETVFSLVAEDVTPAPYNQPPYPLAGDTDTDSCTVMGIAP
jgi:hypothetical protein